MMAHSSGETKMKIPTYDYTPAPGWSYSRNKTLRECLRKYWFTYYGSKYADPAIREKIIKIKSLTSLPLTLGEVLHKSIAQALENVKTTGVLPAMETMVSVSEKALEKSLETRQFIEENGGGINSYKVTAAMQRLHESIGNFYSHSLLPQIISSIIERPEYVLIDPSGYGECRIEGKKAFAKTDLIYSNPEGFTIIIDWKLSNGNRMENLTQLSGYLYYAMNVLHQPLTNMEGRMIYLSSSTQDDLVLMVTKEKAELIKNRILGELKIMENYCTDIDNNIPKSLQAFPRTGAPVYCSWCKFKKLCHEIVQSKNPYSS